MKQLPKYKHYFNVDDNCKLTWEEEDMFRFKLNSLKGKRGYALIEEETNKPTVNQYAYYFGGIIRGECMASNCFIGLSDKEIHQVLFKALRSYTKGIKKIDGTTELISVQEDFSDYKKDDMRLYLEELIPYLELEYNIRPKPAEHYKNNKFYMDTKIYR